MTQGGFASAAFCRAFLDGTGGDSWREQRLFAVDIDNHAGDESPLTVERAREYFMYDILKWDKPKPPAPFPSTVIEDERGRGRPPKIRLRVPVFEDALKELGIGVRWNLVTHRFDFSGIPGEWNLNPESREDGFRVWLEDTLYDVYSGLNRLPDLISAVGDRNRYNPVLEYIEAEPYISEFEHDYTGELLKILGIANDKLSVSLFCSWLEQGIALLHNDEKRHYSPDGILVLQGPQGCGKTSVARGLGLKPAWTLEGARLDAFDKDTHIRLTSRFVSELGELDATFKRTDAARMKAFITSESDTYRRPYGRNDVTMWRRTNLIGTVNEQQFLIDQTGNRRYWTVPVKAKTPDCPDGIDTDALRRLKAPSCPPRQP